MDDNKALARLQKIAREFEESKSKEDRKKRNRWYKPRELRLWLVLSGGYCEQIYLTIPLEQVGKNARVWTLLNVLDSCELELAGFTLYNPEEYEFASGILEVDPSGDLYVLEPDEDIVYRDLKEELWLPSEFDETVRALAQKLLDL